MATCKECLHEEACGGYLPTDTDKDVWDLCAQGRSDEIADIENRCGSFKDKTKYVEQKHGYWILVAENSTGNIYVCSVCNFPHNPNKKDVQLARVEEEPDYCCKCGAKMEVTP